MSGALDPKVARARTYLAEAGEDYEMLVRQNTVHPDECPAPADAPDVAWLVVDGP